MELTPQNKAKIDALKEAGYSNDEILTFFGAEKYGERSPIHEEEAERARISDEIAAKQTSLADYAKKFTDAIGLEGTTDVLSTDIARRFYGADLPQTTRKERAGAALQLGATAGGFIVTGGSSLLGQIGAGIGLGYLYDVGSDLIENKTVAETATPGGATLAGGLIPVGLRGLGAAGGALTRGMTKGPADEIVEETTEAAVGNIKSFVEKTPVQGAAERITEFGKRFPRAFRHVKEYVDEGAEIAERKKNGTPAIVNALDEGLDIRTVDFVENFDDPTRQKALEMLDLADSPRGAAAPQTVPANIASDQFELVVTKRQEIGRQIGELSEQLGDTPQDMLPSLRSLRIMLQENGIMPYKEGMQFTAKNYTPQQQKLIEQLYDLATADEKLTAKQIHQFDQLFSKLQREARFDGLDDVYVKVKGTDGQTYDVNVFKAFRNVFNDKLNTIDGGKFRDINRQYAFYRNLQDDLESTLFKGAQEANLQIDPADTAVNNMRRIFSNAQSQPKFKEAYNALDAASRELGYDGARADVLYDFYLTDMKPLYPETVRPASFEGGIRGGLSGILDTVQNVGKASPQDKQRALRGLLEPDNLGQDVVPNAPAASAVENADDFFEKRGAIERLRGALGDQRGAINPDRRIGGNPFGSSVNTNTLSPRGEDTVRKFLGHVDGSNKLPADEWKRVQSDMLTIANRANFNSKGGGNKEIANEAAERYQKYIADWESFNQSATTKTTDLLEEARKYPDVESFIEAQGEPVYHGTRADAIKEFDLSKARESGYSKIGVWTSDNTKSASTYGTRVETIIPPQNANLLRIDSWEQFETLVASKHNARKDLGLGEEHIAVRDFLKKEGYDGIEIPSVDIDDAPTQTIRVFIDPSKLKTRSQLEEIWKQANGE